MSLKLNTDSRFGSSEPVIENYKQVVDGVSSSPFIQFCGKTEEKSGKIGGGKGRTELVITNSVDMATTDWRKLFAIVESQNLQFFPPLTNEGKVIIKPPAEVFEEGILQWKNSLVAQFIGKPPNFSHFQKLVNLLWGKDGVIDIKLAGKNLYVIQFPNAETRDWVLERGPWHIHNNPIILRKWEPGLKSLEFNMSKLPVWVHLSNIPLELYTATGLSYIASALGTPLYMDQITASKQRLAYAKVCVEIAAAQHLPKTIEVELRNGSVVFIQVEIPWMPPKCNSCGIFGHAEKYCPNKITKEPAKVWIPKTEQRNLNSQNEEQGLESTHKQLKSTEGPGLECQRPSVYDQESSSCVGIMSSANRYAILETIIDKDEELDQSVELEVVNSLEKAKHVSPRKPRAAAAGVADLMRNLKSKKKRRIDKGKAKVKAGSTALRCQTLEICQ